MSTLLVAATGGHLSQLVRLQPRLTGLAGGTPVWLTFDTPQSRSLLAGKQVEFVRFTASRDSKNVLINTLHAPGVFRRHDIETVVSTGNAIALAFLPMASAWGITSHYIESAARSDGPSVSGRLLSRVPGVHLYTQYPAWADERWTYAGSVFDSWSASGAEVSRPVRKLVVTLGTIGYGFRRLLERLVEIIPPDVEVLWQTGVTDVSGLPIDAQPSIPSADLEQAVREADAVVAHSGTGSSILALAGGLRPVLVPRDAAHGEHIDDHQVQIARELDRRGLAVARRVEALDWAAVRDAASQPVSEHVPPPIRLAPAPAKAHRASGRRLDDRRVVESK
jgi:UDP-N-acetylglucosamine--N-acetylmuramyl-(pentapeptide) pyrophosphoryl-undecaprenol N-acetylglucosamine transferase